jgi:DNA-binding NtrC family response regulator
MPVLRDQEKAIGGIMSEDNILIVDDEQNVISALKRTLMEEPYAVYSAESAAEGLEILDRTKNIKVIVSDERMPVVAGHEFLATVKDKFPNIIRIMLTGYADINAAMKAINEGEIYRFFSKPWNDTEIKFIIRSAIEKYDLEAENRRLLSIIRDNLDKEFL